MIKILSLEYNDESLSIGERDLLNKKFEPNFLDAHGNTPNAQMVITTLLGTTFASMGNAQIAPPAMIPNKQNVEFPHAYAGIVQKIEDSGFTPQIISEDINNDELINRLDTLQPAVIHVVCMRSEPYAFDHSSGNKDAKASNFAFYVDSKKFVYVDVDGLISERLSSIEKKIDALKSAENTGLADDIKKDLLSDVIYDFIKTIFKFLIKLLTKDNDSGILMTIILSEEFMKLVKKFIKNRKRNKKSDATSYNPFGQSAVPSKTDRGRNSKKKKRSDVTGQPHTRTSKAMESVHSELAKIGSSGTEKELTPIINKLSLVLTEHFGS